MITASKGRLTCVTVQRLLTRIMALSMDFGWPKKISPIYPLHVINSMAPEMAPVYRTGSDFRSVMRKHSYVRPQCSVS